jgi:hypothetical protein
MTSPTSPGPSASPDRRVATAPLNPGAPPPPALSPRQQLARTALSAALAVDGVTRAAAGPDRTHVTPVGGALLEGVTAIAEPTGRYDVELSLVCRPVALHPLAELVRERVREAVSAAGLQAQLGAVDVRIEDVSAEPGSTS